VVILGSTGSIGTQALDIVRRNPDRFRVVGLAAGGGNPGLLARQAAEFGVPVVAVADSAAVPAVRAAIKEEFEVTGRFSDPSPDGPAGPIPSPFIGPALGGYGGQGGWGAPGGMGDGSPPCGKSAPHAGRLSPREITVLAGEDAVSHLATLPCDVVLNGVTGAAGLRATLAALDAGRMLALANKESLIIGGPLVTGRAKPGQIVPVDSEHSTIAQCLRAGANSEVKRLVLTASGGPFRG